MAWIGWMGLASPQSAPAVPESQRPYRVRVCLAFADQPMLTGRLRQETAGGVLLAAERTVGELWQVSVDLQADPADLLERLERRVADPAAVGRLAAGHDKAFLCRVQWETDRFRLVGRELDAPSGLLGPRFQAEAFDRSGLGAAVIELGMRLFRPRASIESLGARRLRLVVRGGELEPADPRVQFVQPRSVFELVQTGLDAGGQVVEVQPVPWTLVEVEQVEGATATGRMFTALRSPLTRRRRGRWRVEALAVRAADQPTVLPLRTVGEDRPLAGYDVYVSSAAPDPGTYVGATDRQGRVALAPGRPGVTLVLVKSGQESLARLPIVPGADAPGPAYLRPDPWRLSVEGRVRALEVEVLATVARQGVGLAEVRRLAKAGRLEAAAQRLAGVKALPGAAAFLDRLTAIYKEAEGAAGPAGPRRPSPQLEKLFAEARDLIARCLDVDRIGALEKELGQGTSASQPADASVN